MLIRMRQDRFKFISFSQSFTVLTSNSRHRVLRREGMDLLSKGKHFGVLLHSHVELSELATSASLDTLGDFDRLKQICHDAIHLGLVHAASGNSGCANAKAAWCDS